MKTTAHFIIVMFLLSCASHYDPANDMNDKLVAHEFVRWREDSIKSFLADKWVHIGAWQHGQIVEDTIATRDGKLPSDTVDPVGKYYFNDDGKRELQEVIPCLLLNFDGGSADLFEQDYYPPSFDRWNVALRLMITPSLRVKNTTFTAITYRDSSNINVQYLNKDLIIVRGAVFVRAKKWEAHTAGFASESFF